MVPWPSRLALQLRWCWQAGQWSCDPHTIAYGQSQQRGSLTLRLAGAAPRRTACPWSGSVLGPFAASKSA